MNRAIGTVVLMLAAPAWAADQANREIVRTYVNFYLEQNNSTLAAESLETHLSEDKNDAEAWNLLGLVHLQSKQPRHAAQAFRRATRLASPEVRAIYAYNQADALNRAGDTAGARQSLRLAMRDERVEPSAREALDALRPDGSLPPLILGASGPWGAAAGLSSGYDTNVLLLSDATLTTQPTGARSPYLSPFLQLAHRKRFETSLLRSNLTSSYTHYTMTDSRPFNSLLNLLTSDWGPTENEGGSFNWTIGAVAELNLLNSDGLSLYNWGDSLRWRGNWRVLEKADIELEIPVRYQKYALEDDVDPEDDRTGFGTRPSLSSRISFDSGTLVAGAWAERHQAKGSNYRANAMGFPLGFSRSIGMFSSSLAGEYSYTNYFSSSDDGTNRIDRLGSFSVTVSTRLFSESVVALEYVFRRNLSTDSAAQYSKHSGGLMVVHDLF